MNGIKLFNDLMEYADGKGASDVHLVPGRTAMLRIDGELTAAGQEDAQNGRCGSYRGDGADLVRGSAGRVPHERLRWYAAIHFPKRCVCACPYTDSRGEMPCP